MHRRTLIIGRSESGKKIRRPTFVKRDVSPDDEEAVVTFDSITILTPRGRYNAELHLSFLRLQGEATDFEIQYSSIVRVYVLPKSNQPHTYVVVTLDPPILKGQTLYPHIVMQFETDYVVERTLVMNEELYAAKYKDKLEPSYKEIIHEVFTMTLCGLASTKTTRPGRFRSCQDGYAVKSSLKAEDGVLYPLKNCFFFLPKPPTLIPYDVIDYVQFERHITGRSNMHYYDLLIRLKTEKEHLFRNIQSNEYHNLYDFISSKGLKLMKTYDYYEPRCVFPPPPGGSKLVLVCNLSPTIQETDILEFFKDAGKIDWVRITRLKGRLLHTAHIRFDTSEAAQKALRHNGEELIGHDVKVLLSDERSWFDMVTLKSEYKYLFMGNLHTDIKENEIVDFFKDNGEVVSVYLRRAGGHFLGYGHIEFASSLIAHKALRRNADMLHGKPVELVLATEDTVWFSHTPSSGIRRHRVFRHFGRGPTKNLTSLHSRHFGRGPTKNLTSLQRKELTDLLSRRKKKSL